MGDCEPNWVLMGEGGVGLFYDGFSVCELGSGSGSGPRIPTPCRSKFMDRGNSVGGEFCRGKFETVDTGA